MKSLIFIPILLITFLNVNAQGIGELAPAKPPVKFPKNALGIDIMFSNGGFGLGGFYRHRLSETITGFTDLSISEAKDPREFTYVDYWGNTYTLGKKNRVFLLPLNFGIQYRLFENTIYYNFRPYLNIGVGPTMIVTDPYHLEFFKAFSKARIQFTAGGYVGFGANFGINKNSLVGLNIRYYFIHLFNEGIEIMRGSHEKDLGGLYITLTLGMMY